VHGLERHAIWGILALALGLRVGALLALQDSIYSTRLLWDEELYHKLAVRILEGRDGSNGLWPNLLALLYGVTGASVFWVRIVNVGFGTLACGVLYLIGRELGGRRIGLISAAIGAIYGPFVFYSAVPLRATLSVLSFGATAWLGMSARRSPTLLRVGLLGVSAWLMIETRANTVALLPLLLVIPYESLRSRGWKRGALVAAVLALGMLLPRGGLELLDPRVPGQYRPSTPEAGLNFYLGNNPNNPTPYFQPAPFAVPIPYIQGGSARCSATPSPSRAAS
jgi:hypothetical protein